MYTVCTLLPRRRWCWRPVWLGTPRALRYHRPFWPATALLPPFPAPCARGDGQHAHSRNQTRSPATAAAKTRSGPCTCPRRASTCPTGWTGSSRYALHTNSMHTIALDLVQGQHRDRYARHRQRALVLEKHSPTAVAINCAGTVCGRWSSTNVH